MKFQGEVIAEACSLALKDRQVTVSMGKLGSNYFQSAGQYAQPVVVDVHLENCSIAVSQRVGVSIYGVADIREPYLLAVDKDKDATDSVAIALFDKNLQPIKLNTPLAIKKNIINGTNTLHFIARYKAMNYPVKGGKANGMAWFYLTYE